MSSIWKEIAMFIEQESTFFRIHLLCFTFIPLASSGIFYACNGRFHISYLDSLFLCYSAMTDTGLSTVNLSTTTPLQQVILFVLMGMGDITVVSWIMVLVRLSYFRRKCEYIRSTQISRQMRLATLLSRSRSAVINAISSPISASPLHKQHAAPIPEETKLGSALEGLSLENTPSSKLANTAFAVTRPTPATTLLEQVPTHNQDGTAEILGVGNGTTISNRNMNHISDLNTFSSSPQGDNASLPSLAPVTSRTHGVEFVSSVSLTPSVRRRMGTIRESVPYRRTTTITTFRSQKSAPGIPVDSSNSKYSGMGGFPGPLTLAKGALKRLFPGAIRKLERKLTLPHTTTLHAQQPSQEPFLGRDVNVAPWLKLDGLIVSRNSFFHTDSLTDEQLEEIGGVEYRALRLLSYLVPFYFITAQLLSYLLFAPWLATTHEYDGVFEAQPRLVKKPWFSLFQVMGGYTGGGLSLVDLSMVPFQRAYLMIFSLMFVLLAGNHAMPIFLRLIIWICSKSTTQGSRLHETLSFLLDHPRRCFVYLFPSHQTWFLAACLFAFSLQEWVSFMVLDIGLEVTRALPVGTRIVAGLFQGLAARASGFAIVSVSALAPAVQFLYVIMMYIAIYPVAMAVRSTNVYEEQSLGVYEVLPEDGDEEPDVSGSRRERVGKYVHWHIRRQLSAEIWWLVWAVFLVCIVERHNLLDETSKWFDIFRVTFELVSAFGGIGLSLGIPSENFSFSGILKPLSKLVVIVIMVRGRHRGLPSAVDRSILLPHEMVTRQSGHGQKADDVGEVAAQIPDQA